MLRAYKLRPEDYPLRYSELKKTQGQSYSEFVAKKSGMVDKWVASHQLESYTFTGIWLPVSLRIHLEDSDIKTIEHAGIAADDYVLITIRIFPGK